MLIYELVRLPERQPRLTRSGTLLTANLCAHSARGETEFPCLRWYGKPGERKREGGRELTNWMPSVPIDSRGVKIIRNFHPANDVGACRFPEKRNGEQMWTREASTTTTTTTTTGWHNYSRELNDDKSRGVLTKRASQGDISDGNKRNREERGVIVAQSPRKTSPLRRPLLVENVHHFHSHALLISFPYHRRYILVVWYKSARVSPLPDSVSERRVRRLNSHLHILFSLLTIKISTTNIGTQMLNSNHRVNNIYSKKKHRERGFLRNMYN